MIPVKTAHSPDAIAFTSIDWDNTTLYSQSPQRRARTLLFVAKQLGYKAAFNICTKSQAGGLILQVKHRLNLVDKGNVEYEEYQAVEDNSEKKTKQRVLVGSAQIQPTPPLSHDPHETFTRILRP